MTISRPTCATSWPGARQRCRPMPSSDSGRLTTARARRRPRLALGVGAAAAAAVLLTVATVATQTLLTQAPSAFAGWSAQPKAVERAAAAAADATCREQLANTPMPLGGALKDLEVAVTDGRGPFTWVLYNSAGGGVSCLVGPSLTAISGRTGNGGSFGIAAAGVGPASGPVGAGSSATAGSGSMLSTGDDGSRVSTVHLTTDGGQAYTLADGTVADDVTGVTLVLGDGTRVAATVANGWFAAWWPGGRDATSIEVTTPDGATTRVLPAPPAPPAPGECPAGAVCQVNPAP